MSKILGIPSLGDLVLLKSIEKEPLRSLQYLERYVNDGSPSGFTEIHRSSARTNPFSLTPWYHPFYLQAEQSSIEVFGLIPDRLPSEESLGSNWFIIHPDMSGHSDLKQLKVQELNNLKVVPTSSDRTVQIFDSTSCDYLKLHYDGYIGRIDRKLPRERAISGPEISLNVLEAIEQHLLPDHLCILHETGAKILSINDDSSVTWGMIWRDSKPRGPNAHHIAFLIPLFALWSVDRLSSYEAPLIEPLCRAMGDHAASYLIEDLLFPIVDSYFAFLLKLGFQIELNAQNLLVGFSEDWRPVAIVLRDMMGTEKDLALRNILGLTSDFKSAPYKILKNEDPSYYRIRHSFVFDFKIGAYVLDPIIYCASKSGHLNADETVQVVRERSKFWIKQLPEDFFPENGRWYRHDRVLLTHPRSYIAEPNPRYR